MVNEFEQETDLWRTGFEDEQGDFGEDNEEEYFYQPEEEQEEQEQEGLEDQPEGSEEPSNEEDDDINVSYFLANALKEQGVINADEIPKDIDEQKVFELYKESHKERLFQEVQDELSKTLQSRGITEDHLAMAMALESGYHPDMLLEQNRYKAFSGLPDDVDTEDKKAVVAEWYQYRGLFEDEIKEKLDELELDDEKLDINFKRAKGTFKEVSEGFEKQVRQEALERDRLMHEAQQKNQQLLQNVRTTGELAGEKMTKPQLEQFERGIFTRDQKVEVNGQVFSASKFEKFMHDIQNNFESQLLAYKLYTMRDIDKEINQKQIEDKVEEKLLSGLKTALEKKYKGTIRRGQNDKRDFKISPNAKVFSVR